MGLGFGIFNGNRIGLKKKLVSKIVENYGTRKKVLGKIRLSRRPLDLSRNELADWIGTELSANVPPVCLASDGGHDQQGGNFKYWPFQSFAWLVKKWRPKDDTALRQIVCYCMLYIRVSSCIDPEWVRWHLCWSEWKLKTELLESILAHYSIKSFWRRGKIRLGQLMKPM